MMDYRKVLQFYYNGNVYNMYLDHFNKHFFLKNDENGLSYVTIEELIDLTLLFIDMPLVMNIKKDFKKTIFPKIIAGGLSITLSLSLLDSVLEMDEIRKKIRDFEESRNTKLSQSIEQDIKNYISFFERSIESQKASDQLITEQDNSNEDFYNEQSSVIEIPENNNEQNELVVDTFLESDWLNYLYIYDMQYLDKALDYKVSIDEVKNLIENSLYIPDKFKNLFYEYCNNLVSKYPNIELRVLYENLKTLEVVECDKMDLIKHSLSVDSYGCYVRTENKIYVLKDYDYIKGTWPYQVIFHEFSHCLRTGNWLINGKKIKVQIEGQNFSNTITAEALNSLFTVSLFDYDEKDIAYQLQSNYHNVMIECMDNYTLEDYVNHSISYYAKKLDEFNNDKNYATIILELIQTQYQDYHNDSINVSQEEYFPIYDYIADMYYKKYLDSSMSYSEALDLTNELINKIMFDVPEEYAIDVNHFYDHLNNYCETLGIQTNMTLKN